MAALSVLLWNIEPTPARTQDHKEQEPPLPTRVVIDIDAPDRDLYRIAVPNLLGPAELGAKAAGVLRNDLKLVSLFRVLDSRSFVADLASEALGIVPNAWTVVGAQGVVKGSLKQVGDQVSAEMRLFEPARGHEPVLSRSYRGSVSSLRLFMHQFANELLRVLTGKSGAFHTKLTYARRVGPGRKDVYVADYDGANIGRVSSGRGVSMLPSFGAGGVWYSVLTKRGMFITNTRSGQRPVIRGAGLNMGVSVCGQRVYFSSTRSGNSEIYSARVDGSDVRRLTRHPGIDVSPACGPGGKIAFVSSRHGGPQIFTMSATGGMPKRVTYRGAHNQTPAWCPDPKKPMLAFTGRDGGFDVFTLDLRTGHYTRLTQGQGINKDPAFSPDCRMVAFASSRGGVFVSNPEGLNQNRVIAGLVETVRWSR